MSSKNLDKISLRLPPRVEHLPLVQAAVEKSGVVAGLSKMKTLKTTLAVEEIFCYLCGVANQREQIRLAIDYHGYFMHAGFQFNVDEGSYGDLNLICKGKRVKPTGPIKLNLFEAEDDFGMDDMDLPDLGGLGLLLASRSVDKMYLEKIDEDLLEISLLQEKEYPEESMESLDTAGYAPPYTVSTHPGARDLRKAAALTREKYHSAMYPGSLSQPGKLADAVINDQMGSCVALDSRDNPVGLLCWSKYNKQSMAFYGPYVFDDENKEEISRQLAENFLDYLAPHEDVFCVFSLRTTAELPKNLFVRLGGIHLSGPKQSLVIRPAYFSYLPHDKPAEVWSHPDLDAYLKEEYRRLDLVRDIHYSREEDEYMPEKSVISAEIDRAQGEVILRPLWGGSDLSENVKDHVEALKQENIPNVFFHMDLAHSFQPHFTPALLENGFSPKLVIPYGADLDIVVFQYEYAV